MLHVNGIIFVHFDVLVNLFVLESSDIQCLNIVCVILFRPTEKCCA